MIPLQEQPQCISQRDCGANGRPQSRSKDAQPRKGAKAIDEQPVTNHIYAVAEDIGIKDAAGIPQPCQNPVEDDGRSGEGKARQRGVSILQGQRQIVILCASQPQKGGRPNPGAGQKQKRDHTPQQKGGTGAVTQRTVRLFPPPTCHIGA